jgi:hypothetical protein
MGSNSPVPHPVSANGDPGARHSFFAGELVPLELAAGFDSVLGADFAESESLLAADLYPSLR